jgi:hypothetical protein
MILVYSYTSPHVDDGDALCADVMAALSCDRAAGFGAMPVPLAAALVRSAVPRICDPCTGCQRCFSAD